MNRTSRLSILHVDDDADLRDLVKLQLEREENAIECTVRTEGCPQQALDLIRDPETAFDCVISDYNMPAMNGIEFLRAVRDSHPELPVLLFSGEETADIAAEIVEAGLTDYLRKGYGLDQYTMLIRRVSHAVESDGAFDSEMETELDGVGVVGRDEHFDDVDDTYASMYGYSADELTGKHWTELHPDEEVEHIRTHVLPVVERGGKWTGRSEGLRSDNTRFTESKLVTALDDGRLLIAVSELDDSPLAGEV
ncbi:response regulator [Halomicroarcula sp. GCM10025324]|uniref:response regulator n=1 Tax=Haloarcula TaxID=2237 RepID=UPI0023E8062E|nr:response regulator [Halomicroarcula sp. ZS-22-S1]